MSIVVFYIAQTTEDKRQNYCLKFQSERRAERLSRARRPQYGAKRRRPPTRIQKQPKENECFTNTDDTRSNSPPQFDYITHQKTQCKFMLKYYIFIFISW